MHNNQPIQLWLARTGECSFGELWDRHADYLPQQEKDKVLSYKFDKDRILSLVSKVMLRTLLSTHFPAKNTIDWCFSANRFGKPFIDGSDDERRLQFNLSHTDGMVACALSVDNEIGVDVEVINKKESLFDIEQTVFTAREVTSLHSYTHGEDRFRHFFRLWTLKEAYIKYIGGGLSIPLQEFEFEFQKGKIIFKKRNDNPAQTPPAFCSALIAPRHILSIAMQSANSSVVNIDMKDFSDLKNAKPIDIQFDLSSTDINHLLSE